MRRVYQRPAARRDLIDHYAYLAGNASEEVADRFLTRAEESFVALADHREMGVALHLRRLEFEGLRKWQVKEFEQFLIFYLPRPDGISVIRVIYSAQDWWGELGVET